MYKLHVGGIQSYILTVNIFLINSSPHLATPPTGGVSSVAIGVSIAVVVPVITGAVVILIACVVWKYGRSGKKVEILSVSKLLIVTRIDNTVYPLLHAVY